MIGPHAVDDGERVERLVVARVDVRCPTCGARALVRPMPVATTDDDPSGRSRHPTAATLFGPHRLSCGSCGLVRETDTRRMTIHDDGHDPWFHEPLWFRERTPAGVVWAYHEDHLRALREWVAAGHRECHVPGGWRSTLPDRLTARSVRTDVVRTIDTMLRSRRPTIG